MPDMRISEDTVLLVARLVNEAEDMKDAANETLKDTWADHRETLKSLGLTGKEVSAEVAQLKAAIAESRLSSVDLDKRESKTEGKDEYLAILRSPRARARKASPVTTENTNNSGDDSDESEPEVPTPKKAVATLRADPTLSIVDAASIKPKSETQPAPQAGSDLTNPASLNGQVASMQPETADEPASNGGSQSPDVAGTDLGAAAPSSGEAQQPVADAGKSAGASAPAAPPATYPAPGEIYWENTPREPVRRHEYSVAFGDFGQDHVVIAEDISCARSAPIVMIGSSILDGWARYNCARCTVGLDGQTTHYPAVQYDGTDPLMDCIRWNMAGRILTESQKRAIVQRLVRLEPKRKADIFKAMDMGMELA